MNPTLLSVVTTIALWTLFAFAVRIIMRLEHDTGWRYNIMLVFVWLLFVLSAGSSFVTAFTISRHVNS